MKPRLYVRTFELDRETERNVTLKAAASLQIRKWPGGNGFKTRKENVEFNFLL